MRNMSFQFTIEAFLDGSKDVTRRTGWQFLKSGDRVMAVEKAMGLKKGEGIKRLGAIEIVSVKREPISAMLDDLDYGWNELCREGYPFGATTPQEFVRKFCLTANCLRSEQITRIEFKRL